MIVRADRYDWRSLDTAPVDEDAKAVFIRHSLSFAFRLRARWISDAFIFWHTEAYLRMSAAQCAHLHRPSRSMRNKAAVTRE
jgi:hypothetical protein